MHTILRSMYVEKHFIRNRDLAAYVRKQAGSCLYLCDKLTKWETETENDVIKAVVGYLKRVHIRQFFDLKLLDMKRPQESFYFDALDKDIESEEERLAMHLVSYERGRLRYRQLRWQILERDATCNRDACIAALSIISPDGNQNLVQQAAEREALLMKIIDDHKDIRAK